MGKWVAFNTVKQEILILCQVLSVTHEAELVLVKQTMHTTDMENCCTSAGGSLAYLALLSIAGVGGIGIDSTQGFQFPTCATALEEFYCKL